MSIIVYCKDSRVSTLFKRLFCHHSKHAGFCYDMQSTYFESRHTEVLPQYKILRIKCCSKCGKITVIKIK